VDHILGLRRLWAALPDDARTGTYVHFNEDPILELLRNASQAGALIIGEDLGNIPPGLRSELRASGVYGTDVLWWTRGTDGTIRTGLAQHGRENAVLVTGFHDTSSLARFIRGNDIHLLSRLNRLGEETGAALSRRRSDLLEFLPSLPRTEQEVREGIASVYEAVFAGPQRLVSIYYPDLLAQECTENVPGTHAAEYQNWRTAYGTTAPAPTSIHSALSTSFALEILSLRR